MGKLESRKYSKTCVFFQNGPVAKCVAMKRIQLGLLGVPLVSSGTTKEGGWRLGKKLRIGEQIEMDSDGFQDWAQNSFTECQGN